MTRRNLPIFIITAAYFLLAFINILFALSAAVCIALPFILLQKTKKKTWCRGLCPRADFLTRLRPLNIGLKLPRWFNIKRLAKIMLYYFGLNFFFITMSTVMVSLGRIDPIEKVRLLIMFQLPWELTQLIPLEKLPVPIVHLSYRFYSMMLTSTLLGTILAVLFKPRTWCGICPVNSISNKMLSIKPKEPISNE